MGKQTKLTKSARGQECQIRIPGICNFNPETTVLAHLNGGGIGAKHLDIHGAYACSDCHDAVDRRSNNHGFLMDELEMMHMDGMVRTQVMMVNAGLIKI